MQDRQLLSTVVFTAGGDIMRESRRHSEGETEEARDPDPDVEARQDFWSIVGNSHISESCCCENESLFSEKRLSATS